MGIVKIEENIFGIWDDPEFVAELDRRVAEYERGAIKVSTWDEVKAEVPRIRAWQLRGHLGSYDF